MVTVLKIGNGYVSPNRKEYLVDDVSEIANLPTSSQPGSAAPGTCDPGSIAYTADLSVVYMLGNDDEWHDIMGG